MYGHSTVFKEHCIGRTLDVADVSDQAKLGLTHVIQCPESGLLIQDLQVFLG